MKLKSSIESIHLADILALGEAGEAALEDFARAGHDVDVVAQRGALLDLIGVTGGGEPRDGFLEAGIEGAEIDSAGGIALGCIGEARRERQGKGHEGGPPGHGSSFPDARMRAGG